MKSFPHSIILLVKYCYTFTEECLVKYVISVGIKKTQTNIVLLSFIFWLYGVCCLLERTWKLFDYTGKTAFFFPAQLGKHSGDVGHVW